MNSIAQDLKILDQLATAVVCLDSTFTITYINAAAEQLLRKSSAYIVGRRIDQVLSLPDALMQNLSNAMKLGQPYRDRQLNLTAVGMELGTVDLLINPFKNDQQEATVLLEIATVERSVRIARDDALLAQQTHLRSLLRTLAHEIKNPLGGVRGSAQLLDKQLVPELREYTSIIIRESDRLQTLIDRMFGPATHPDLKPLNIHEVLEHVRKLLLLETPKGVIHAIDYDPSIPDVISDTDRLVQVFLNVARNALQAVGELGRIDYKTRVVRQHTLNGTRHPLVVAVTISDNGHGIPAELLDQIFYPMVSDKPNGSGLGLSIAQSIVQQLGGLIKCQSCVGETSFTVIIPLEAS